MSNDFFGSIRDAAGILPFDNERSCGLLIKWALDGIGFGEITIAYRKEGQEWIVDDESNLHEANIRIFQVLMRGGQILEEEPNVKVTTTLSLAMVTPPPKEEGA